MSFVGNFRHVTNKIGSDSDEKKSLNLLTIFAMSLILLSLDIIDF